MQDSQASRLNIPAQDLKEFSLFPPNAAAAVGWAQALPVANTAATIDLLGQALEALNRFPLGPEIRFDIMESLRPNLEVVLSSLSRRYLNQPLVLPREPQKAVNESNRLRTLASTGYALVAVEAVQQRDSIRETNPARLACQALHRALVSTGGKVLQAYQLFRPLQMQDWQTLHQLYALADRQQLTELPVPDPLGGGATIHVTYLQSVLLGCCKPHHLRQGDLRVLFEAFGTWADRVAISPGGDGLFAVDLNSDQPALYRSLYQERRDSNTRIIDTSGLVQHLRALRDERGEADTLTAPVELLEHLIACLGTTSQRNFQRTASNTTLQVCLGLSSTHYHVANQRSFERLLYGDDFTGVTLNELESQRFLHAAEHPHDAWERGGTQFETQPGQAGEMALAHTVNPSAHERELLEKGRIDATEVSGDARYPVYEVQLADVSPGGYCLHWTGELPHELKHGDIVGLREDAKRDWGIAVIRWLRPVDNSRTLIGLELLSPRAMPYGASIHKGKGALTPPIRVLLLPQIKLIGQPETLITPRAGFKENQKLTLANHAEQCSVQLQRQMSYTGSFVQYEFRFIKTLGDVLSEKGEGTPGAGYESLWSNI
jgi:hypothetical protein